MQTKFEKPSALARKVESVQLTLSPVEFKVLAQLVMAAYALPYADWSGNHWEIEIGTAMHQQVIDAMDEGALW